jgi:hypothetical protein
MKNWLEKRSSIRLFLLLMDTAAHYPSPFDKLKDTTSLGGRIPISIIDLGFQEYLPKILL